MKRVASSRQRHVDVLRRRPVAGRRGGGPARARSPYAGVDQVRALLRLVDRGRALGGGVRAARRRRSSGDPRPSRLAPGAAAAAAGRSRPPPRAS